MFRCELLPFLGGIKFGKLAGGGGFHRRNTAGLNQGDFLAANGEHFLCLPTHTAPFRFGGVPLLPGRLRDDSGLLRLGENEQGIKV
jgi:hypothetical protein